MKAAKLAKPACACEADVDIRVSSVEDMRRNASVLLKAHFEEVAVLKSRRELQPNWPEYYAYEDAGRLFAFAAWFKGEMIGYIATIEVPSHLHYAGLHCALNDVLFVAEEFRLSSIGSRLRRLTLDEAKRRGCTEINWHCKKDSALHQILAAKAQKSDRVVLQDIIYTEVIE